MHILSLFQTLYNDVSISIRKNESIDLTSFLKISNHDRDYLSSCSPTSQEFFQKYFNSRSAVAASLRISQVNKNYHIQASDPLITEEDYIPRTNPYSVVCTSLVRDTIRPFKEFTEQLDVEIKSWPANTHLAVLPEYYWRLTPPEEVFDYINTSLKKNITKNLVLVLGTLEFTLNDEYTSNAIILFNEKSWYRSKIKLLESEVNQGLKYGTTPSVIKFPHVTLGVPICADYGIHY